MLPNSIKAGKWILGSSSPDKDASIFFLIPKCLTLVLYSKSESNKKTLILVVFLDQKIAVFTLFINGSMP